MSTKTTPALEPLSIALCCLPILLHVGRLIIDGEASTEAMATIAIVALFGLTALIGQKWSVKFAPAVFLLSGAPLVVYGVMGLSHVYWLLVWGISWSSYELAVSKDIRTNLLARGA